MRRIILLSTVAAVLVVAMMGFQAPAWAQEQTTSEGHTRDAINKLKELNDEYQNRLDEKVEQLRQKAEAKEEISASDMFELQRLANEYTQRVELASSVIAAQQAAQNDVARRINR